MRKNIKTAYIIVCILLILALVALVPQIDALKNSLGVIKNANAGLLVAGLGAVYLTYVAATFTLQTIALKKLNFRKTLLVQLSSGFATKLVPAGIGGVALNIRYLTKSRHSFVEASSVYALNNLLGFIGQVFIVIFALLSVGNLNSTWLRLPDWVPNATLLILFVVSLILVVWPKARTFVIRNLAKLLGIVRFYVSKPQKLAYGFIWTSTITLLFATCLYLSARSIGVNLSPVAVLLTLTVGLAGAGVTPTPGGLGGAEAAMTGALIATGLTLEKALSIALLYRFLTYWLPILPGILFFRLSLKRGYI